MDKRVGMALLEPAEAPLLMPGGPSRPRGGISCLPGRSEIWFL